MSDPLAEVREAWNTPPRADESNEDWEARRDTMVDALLNPPCPKGCYEKETGRPHVAHTGRCGLPTGHLGVVSCYCTTP